MPLSITQLSFKIFPGTCVLCHRTSKRTIDLCAACEADLPKNLNPCPYCSVPLQEGGTLCRECLSERPGWSAAISGYVYRFPVDALIQRFKDDGHLASGIALARLFAVSLPRLPANAILVPIPLSAERKRTRGFNQAEIIARVIQREINVSIRNDLLVNQRKQSQQRQLNKTARALNRQSGYSVTTNLQGRNILLVDDVITTGATIKAATDKLLTAGAADVTVLSLARTPA